MAAHKIPAAICLLSLIFFSLVDVIPSQYQLGFESKSRQKDGEGKKELFGYLVDGMPIS